MARTYAKLKGSIWQDDDWRALPASHQRVYLLLFSQPEISNCGVLPYLPGRWARMAADTTLDELEQIIADLQEARFVVADKDACELLIRTYVKHDQVAEQPKIRAAAVRQFNLVHSTRIRSALAAEYPDVFQLEPHEQADPEPYGEPFPEGYGEGYGEPPRARAQAATGYRTPSNRTLQPPAAPAATGAANTAAAAAAIERLRAAGWTDNQLGQAAAAEDRALAWLEHFETDPTAKKPGALAWQKFVSTTDWPEKPRSEIATGATGTRSSSPPLPDRPPADEPERTPPPADFLALAGRPPAPQPPAPTGPTPKPVLPQTTTP